MPTLLGLAGAPPPEPGEYDGHDLGPLPHGEQDAVRDAVLFTYTTTRPGPRCRTAGPAQPHPLRARRPLEVRRVPGSGDRAAPECQLHDLECDPAEEHGLVDWVSGRARTAAAGQERARLAARLAELCAESGTAAPALPV